MRESWAEPEVGEPSGRWACGSVAGRYKSGPISYRNGVPAAVRCPASGSDDRSLVVLGECQVCGLGVSFTNVGTIGSHHRTRMGQSSAKFLRLLRIVQAIPA